MDGMSLKWKREKKQIIPQTSNIFFQANGSFDGYKENSAPWAPLKQHSIGISWTILDEIPLGPHSEFFILRMLALDTENLVVSKVPKKEFGYDTDLRTKAVFLLFATLSSKTKKKPKTISLWFWYSQKMKWYLTTYSMENFCRQVKASCLFTQKKTAQKWNHSMFP